MSEKTARAQRSNGNGAAIENLPDLNDLLGFSDKAAIDANRILGLAQTLHNLSRVQLSEGLRDSDVVPFPDAGGRTFAEQRAEIDKSYKRLVAQIKEDDYWALVEQSLAEAKSR